MSNGYARTMDWNGWIFIPIHSTCIPIAHQLSIFDATLCNFSHVLLKSWEGLRTALLWSVTIYGASTGVPEAYKIL